MFQELTIPYGAKLLLNTVIPKPGVRFEDMEEVFGELCETINRTYGGEKGGFFGGQVLRFSGFVSTEGSLNNSGNTDKESEHYAIITYWRSFEDHEKSHADAVFKEKFSALKKMCSTTEEVGYEMLWQGQARNK